MFEATLRWKGGVSHGQTQRWFLLSFGVPESLKAAPCEGKNAKDAVWKLSHGDANGCTHRMPEAGSVMILKVSRGIAKRGTISRSESGSGSCPKSKARYRESRDHSSARIWFKKWSKSGMRYHETRDHFKARIWPRIWSRLLAPLLRV